MGWKCLLCKFFQGLTLRILLSHYNRVHGNDVNAVFRCQVNSCPATFTRANSLYKHVTRHHQQVYNHSNQSVINDCETETVGNSVPEDINIQNECLDQALMGVELDDDFNQESNSESITNSSGDDFDDIEFDSTDSSSQEIDVQTSAASFLLKVKEKSKISQVALDDVVNHADVLIKQVLGNVEKDLTNHVAESDDNNSNFLTSMKKIIETHSNAFADLGTAAKQTAFFIKNFNYVNYIVVKLGSKMKFKKMGNKRNICEVDESFIYIPILKSIEQLLSNPRICSMILEPPTTSLSDDIYYDHYDGSFYKNDLYFQQHQNALAIILYHDELEICNPLGSKAGVHKVDMYYYSLANLNPKFRSKRCGVRLLAIVYSTLVKKYGIAAILKPVIDDLKKLYSGWDVYLGFNNEKRTIYGKVLLCTGDTLGQHLWGGFKEGVGSSFQKCRHCLCNFEQMQDNFNAGDFMLRTKENYCIQCSKIESAPSKSLRDSFSLIYGINKRSPLCELPGFDVTVQLPQDIMHTVLEGVLQYEIRLILNHFIATKQLKLHQINGSIMCHPYGYSELSAKPGPLKESVFGGEENYKLKYSSSQSHLFLRLFPFIIGPLVDVESEYFKFALDLLKIVNLVFSPVISEKSIQYLEYLIEDHLATFKILFPEWNILPKHHYLIHIPASIRMFGPIIRSSCFAFESAHGYFKQLGRKQNFKNLCLSLAKRCQLNECINFNTKFNKNVMHPLFATEKVCGVIKEVGKEESDNIRKTLKENRLLPGFSPTFIYKVSWTVLYGRKYKIGAVIAYCAEGDPVKPLFGTITAIIMIEQFIYFEVKPMVTSHFDEIHQAYLVADHQDDSTLCSFDTLVDFNVFHLKKGMNDQSFVPVKYDIDDILEQHLLGQNPLWV